MKIIIVLLQFKIIIIIIFYGLCTEETCSVIVRERRCGHGQLHVGKRYADFLRWSRKERLLCTNTACQVKKNDHAYNIILCCLLRGKKIKKLFNSSDGLLWVLSTIKNQIASRIDRVPSTKERYQMCSVIIDDRFPRRKME